MTAYSVPHLHSLHGEHGRMQQNGQIHEEVSMADVVQVVLNVFVDQEGAVSAELPESGQTGSYTCSRCR